MAGSDGPAANTRQRGARQNMQRANRIEIQLSDEDSDEQEQIWPPTTEIIPTSGPDAALSPTDSSVSVQLQPRPFGLISSPAQFLAVAAEAQESITAELAQLIAQGIVEPAHLSHISSNFSADDDNDDDVHPGSLSLLIMIFFY